MSWISRGLSWGPAKDVPILQSRIRDLFNGDSSFVAVIQVMLVRQAQPCKRRPLCLWEFNPEGPCVIQNFLGMTHEEMYKSFFGPQMECPEITEDVGLSSNRAAEQVRYLPAKHNISPLSKLFLRVRFFDQDWLTKAKLIRCSAPLPEGLDNPGRTLPRAVEGRYWGG